jgi:hypothetical protein
VNNKGRGFRLDRRSKVITAIIRVAIDKGLHDIEVNTGRGVRNLLDLGRYFGTPYLYLSLVAVTYI